MQIRVTYFIALVFLCYSFSSCTKLLPPCSGNCGTLDIAGIILDTVTNSPIVNQNVSIIFRPYGINIYGSDSVGAVKTDAHGRFKFSKSFDTSLFKYGNLHVRTIVSPNYILSCWPSSVTPDNYSLDEQSFNSLEDSSLQNIQFYFYPKTILNVKLHRNLNNDMSYSFLTMSFNRPSIEEEVNYYKGYPADTTLSFFTSANVYTSIVLSKNISPGVFTTTTDSIKCSQGKDNSFDITY